MGSYWNLLLNGNSTSRDPIEGIAVSNSLEGQDMNTTSDSIKTFGEEVMCFLKIYNCMSNKIKLICFYICNI